MNCLWLWLCGSVYVWILFVAGLVTIVLCVFWFGFIFVCRFYVRELSVYGCG